jgi:hypothetical protein
MQQANGQNLPKPSVRCENGVKYAEIPGVARRHRLPHGSGMTEPLTVPVMP